MMSGTPFGTVVTNYMNYLKDILNGEIADDYMRVIHDYLEMLGFPEPYPSAEQVSGIDRALLPY